MTHRPMAILLDQARKYGPLLLEHGYISCSTTVPKALRRAIGLRYFEAQAILEEFQCPGTLTPVVIIAEAIIREARLNTRPTKNMPHRIAKGKGPTQLPLL